MKPEIITAHQIHATVNDVAVTLQDGSSIDPKWVMSESREHDIDPITSYDLPEAFRRALTLGGDKIRIETNVVLTGGSDELQDAFEDHEVSAFCG